MTGCDLCSDQGPLVLRARCHITAPLHVSRHGDVLILSCYLRDCRREVARFQVVEPVDGDHPEGVSPLGDPRRAGLDPPIAEAKPIGESPPHEAPSQDRQLLQRLVNFVRHDQCQPQPGEDICLCCSDYLSVAEHIATQAGGIPDTASRREACEACKQGVWCEEHPVPTHRRERDPDRPVITHVAIRWDDRVWSLPKPYRHHDIIRMVANLTGATAIDCSDSRGDQGFLDESGRYLNRKQALVSALLNKQVKDENDIRCGMLFSEDLW